MQSPKSGKSSNRTSWGFPHIHKLCRGPPLTRTGAALEKRAFAGWSLLDITVALPPFRSFQTIYAILPDVLSINIYVLADAQLTFLPSASQQTTVIPQSNNTLEMATTESILQGVNIAGSITDFNKKILSKDAVAFLALLHRSFNNTRKDLLKRRVIRQAELDKGSLPDFLPETKHVRENDAWRGAKPAPGLIDRRVEITGPTDRKMVVNALNSNVWTYMADFEGMLPSTEVLELC